MKPSGEPVTVEEIAEYVRGQVPGLAVLRLHRGVAGQVVIDMIRAGTRGQGQGERALTLITAWADRCGETLTLTPEASPLDGEPRMNKRRLRSWYVRHGFRKNSARLQTGYSEAMHRLPKPGQDRRG